jgi:hypothetical protein
MEIPDSRIDDAIREIAALLATAYRRHHRIQRLAIASNTPQTVHAIGLASTPGESVHVHEVDE